MAGKLKAKAMKAMHKMPNGKMMKNSAMMKKHKKEDKAMGGHKNGDCD